MIDWQIGCSGFHYKHWKGPFYPEDMPQKKWFGYYCEHFNTLELNVTFYRFPRYEFLKTWYETSPSTFKFAVKAPRAITHFKKFKDVGDMLSDFYRVTGEGLQEKLGCVLFQLPPNLHYKPETLERIVSSLDNSVHNVLEFRHPSWWNAELYRVLEENFISFCGMSHPTLPKTPIATSSLLYYRFHGDVDLYRSNYSLNQLENFKDEITQINGIENAYIYFNNDISANAVTNATQLIKFARETQLS